MTRVNSGFTSPAHKGMAVFEFIEGHNPQRRHSALVSLLKNSKRSKV